MRHISPADRSREVDQSRNSFRAVRRVGAPRCRAISHPAKGGTLRAQFLHSCSHGSASSNLSIMYFQCCFFSAVACTSTQSLVPMPVSFSPSLFPLTLGQKNGHRHNHIRLYFASSHPKYSNGNNKVNFLLAVLYRLGFVFSIARWSEADITSLLCTVAGRVMNDRPYTYFCRHNRTRSRNQLPCGSLNIVHHPLIVKEASSAPELSMRWIHLFGLIPSAASVIHR